MDYSSLLTTIAARMNRDDLTDYMGEWIRRVEEEANTRLSVTPVRPMVKTYTLSASTQRVDLPDDFIDVIELTATDSESNSWPMVRLDKNAQFAEYARRLAPGIEYDSAKVRHYKILGDTIVLSSAPSSAYTLTLDCYTKLTPIDETNATNWLMTSHADVYEFGVLAHAAKHVRDYDFYQENKRLFIDGLEMVAAAYPERSRPIARRVTDGPWSADRLGIISYG